MVEKKKPQSVDDIINDYQKFHYKTGKSFKERIKKFEEFHNPENIHALQFAHHAHYTVFGKPKKGGFDKDYPGAYNRAYEVLDEHLAEDSDKLENEDKLAEILETYVDTFLEKVMGPKFKETMEQAESEELSKEDIRELKGMLMGRYHTDEKGNPINILDKDHLYIKRKLKGKKKIELVENLKDLSETVKEGYTRHLQQSAMEGLVSEEDHLDLAKYIKPIFEKRGLTHKQSHLTRSVADQASHYGALLHGASETLIKKAGYKPLKLEEEKKK